MKLSKLRIATIALLFSLILILPLRVKASGSSYSAAFVYAGNSAAALDFKKFLSSYGITVNLITNSSAASQNYSTYNLIIIGNDTAYEGQTDWINWTAASLINASGKPILGLGVGGSYFFNDVAQNIGWGMGWVGFDNGTRVVNATSAIFTHPTSITIPADGIIQLYNSNTIDVDIGVPSPIAGVTLLGSQVTNSSYYPLIMEGTRYFLWGFGGSPSNMTQTGKNLFANVVSYLTSGTTIPEIPDLSMLLLTFLLSTTVAVVATKRSSALHYKRES